jgi:hypothetical protein
VYKARGSWTELRREAGLPTAPPGPDEAALLRRVAGLLHVDDRERADVYASLADPDGPSYDDLTERQQRLARMLLFTLWPGKAGLSSYPEALTQLRSHPAVCAEIGEVVAMGVDAARHVPRSLGEGLLHIPLLSHARYRREELLAALGYASLDRAVSSHVSGVAWAEETQTDALLINLRKTERTFSPTTMYRDYAISSQLFHWESQNATSTTSRVGERYLRHRELGTRIVLFVRPTPLDELGTAPFLCLGQAQYVEHRGERPIAITWKLDRDMPADTFSEATVAAG